ncbi:hypothetical protein AVEN_254679-1 [Araneus ventricosus]|uniref:Uncharacterized protein n=1 Tax=Araneus ventricosus TaxID=182803 RepID=A0A4Y2R5E3_ARAVE|nr:hypothetical protein AVEN_254679-1 [Araneus ventricosus]
MTFGMLFLVPKFANGKSVHLDMRLTNEKCLSVCEQYDSKTLETRWMIFGMLSLVLKFANGKSVHLDMRLTNEKHTELNKLNFTYGFVTRILYVHRILDKIRY